MPEEEIRRDSIRVPSASHGRPKSSSFCVVSLFTFSKNAVTQAFSLPVRTSSLDVLSPRIALIESTIIDLPAPVSPVRTLKPVENSMSAFSITAIFSILNVLSI